MATQEAKLKQLKKQYSDAKNEEIRITTRLDEAKKRRKEAIQDIKDKGYEPKQLKKIIAEKENELKDVLAEIETHLPGENDADDEDFEYDDEE